MYIIIGLVLIGIAVVLYFARQRALTKVMNIKYHETSKINDVVSIYEELRDELGEGNYGGTIVELKGVGNSNNPLTAEHSNKPCLYYKSSVVREYEYTERVTDNDGNTRTVNRRGSQTVSSNEQFIPFYLNDGSGKEIRINPSGASKHTIQTVNRYESEAPFGFNLSLNNVLSNSRTLGYRYTEHIIPNNAQLYILGEASDRDGNGLTVMKPKEKKDNNFIVSMKSEEEIINSTEGSAKMYAVIAVIAAVLGVGAMVFQFIK